MNHIFLCLCFSPFICWSPALPSSPSLQPLLALIAVHRPLLLIMFGHHQLHLTATISCSSCCVQLPCVDVSCYLLLPSLSPPTAIPTLWSHRRSLESLSFQALQHLPLLSIFSVPWATIDGLWKLRPFQSSSSIDLQAKEKGAFWTATACRASTSSLIQVGLMLLLD